MVQLQGAVQVDGKIIDLDAPLKPIPSMWMQLRGLYGGESFQIKAGPDSGAMMSMISLHILQKHNIQLAIRFNVKDIQKNQVPHQGMADSEATSNGVKMDLKVVAFANIWTTCS